MCAMCVGKVNNPLEEKRQWLYILPKYLANQNKPIGHIERYGLTVVVPILIALLLSSLNDLKFFFVFLYALLEFLCAKHYTNRHLFPYGKLSTVSKHNCI